MATSSITKEFVVKDMKAFDALVRETQSIPKRKLTATESPSLAKGRELLKKFSSR